MCQGAMRGVAGDAIAQSPDMPANGGGTGSGSSGEVRCNELMLELRKYLLLLAILAATVTYVAGLNPPGGVWLDTQGGHLTGNQILVVTYHARYNAFSYSNATAFMASGVVILLLVFGFKGKDKVQGEHSNSTTLFVVLRVVMVLDLLALVVAYAAGASRDTLTTVLASVLVSPVFIYVLLHVVMMDTLLSKGLLKVSRFLQCEVCSGDQHTGGACPSCGGRAPAAASNDIKDDDRRRRRKILMLLAIFATTITYTAGLNPPGGFWPDTQEGQDDGHRAGDPVLQHHHRRRFTVFFICNTISFVASLLVIMLLLSNQLNMKIIERLTHLFQRRFFQRLIEPLDGTFKKNVDAAKVLTSISLVGLVGAYAAGSCRETDSTAGVVVLYVLGPMLALVFFACVQWRGNRKGGQEIKTPQTPPTEKKGGLINTAPSLVLLLATLAATVTYQAGLNPPGGFWPDNRDGHKGGDPILFTKHAARYRLFFYFNSTALAASLVVIFMVLRSYLSTRSIKNGSVPDDDEQKSARIGSHMWILEVVMILDLIGLIGAFATGCCRDVSTSIYVIALGGGALVYVVFHIVFFTLHHHDGDDDDTKEKRKLLLLLAILAVTLTYQAGLTPPGGFWLVDAGELIGHRAGDPVLLSNYPRRYTAFFYLNATGFMASVALTILLVNPNLYRSGIKCYALHVCMVAGLFGLMGAYAAGSSRHVRTSIYMIVLIVGLVLIFVTVLLLIFMIKPSCMQKWGSREAICSCGPKQAAGMGMTTTIDNEQSPGIVNTVDASDEPGEGTANKEASSSSISTEETGSIGLHTQRRYLMLLGILAASVTYQAGLAPPGGVWPDNNDEHAVGNPILRDSSHRRYHMFFYCNSASFVASVVVITLQLLVNLTPDEKTRKAMFLVQTAQCMMVLDLVGLLLAYAAGSTREWEASGYIVLLLVGFCIAIHLVVSCFHKKTQWRCLFKSCAGRGQESYECC